MELVQPPTSVFLAGVLDLAAPRLTRAGGQAHLPGGYIRSPGWDSHPGAEDSHLGAGGRPRGLIPPSLPFLLAARPHFLWQENARSPPGVAGSVRPRSLPRASRARRSGTWRSSNCPSLSSHFNTINSAPFSRTRGFPDHS